MLKRQDSLIRRGVLLIAAGVASCVLLACDEEPASPVQGDLGITAGLYVLDWPRMAELVARVGQEEEARRLGRQLTAGEEGAIQQESLVRMAREEVRSMVEVTFRPDGTWKWKSFGILETGFAAREGTWSRGPEGNILLKGRRPGGGSVTITGHVRSAGELELALELGLFGSVPLALRLCVCEK
jgi:hypothetical protein